MQMQNTIDTREIADGLKTTVFGKNGFTVFSTTDSTSTAARDLALRGYPEGSVVIAEEQSGGRGQRGRTWFSPAGHGLYMSVILRPKLSTADVVLITLMSSVAVAEALIELTSLDCRIKWPNDIMIGGKKACGILSEMTAGRDGTGFVVVGIGVNVSTPPEIMPGDIAGIATSLLIESGAVYSKNRAARLILERFERYYEYLKQGKKETVLDRWRRLSGTLGARVRVSSGCGFLEGRAIDIDETGGLLIEDQAGTLRTVVTGDVTIISADP